MDLGQRLLKIELQRRHTSQRLTELDLDTETYTNTNIKKEIMIRDSNGELHTKIPTDKKKPSHAGHRQSVTFTHPTLVRVFQQRV